MKSLSRLLAATTVSAVLLLSAGCSSDSTNSEAAGHISRAETYAEQGQYRSALLEVRNAVQKDPGNVDHVVILAGIYNRMGAGQQASDLLEPWVADYSEHVALPLARAYIQQRKHLSAREALDRITPTEPEDRLEHRVLTAQTQRLAGNPEQAIATLEPVLSENRDHQEATRVMALAMIENGNHSGALRLLNSWQERNGRNPELLYLAGLSHYRSGNLDQATNTLTDATSVVPNSDIFLPVRRDIITLLSRALTEQGNITEAQIYNRILAENSNREVRDRAESAIEAITRGDLDTARTTLEELLLQNPENEQVAMMLGALSLQEGRRDEAESLLVERIDAETTPAPFIRAATIAQIDAGKREEAMSTLSRAIEARPNDVELLAMHGILALSLPEYADRGVASLSKALNLDGSRSRLRLALARHYMQHGQQEQALGQMRMAYTNSPTDWSIAQNYLSLLIQTGQQTEAEEVKDGLLNAYSNEPQAVLLASLTEFQLGNVESAKQRLTKQAADNPDWPPALLALGAVYQGSGETQKAIDALVSAAALNPDNLTPLQHAGRLYASNHSPDEVVTWLLQTADAHDSLMPSTRALAAQIRTQQGQLDEADALLGDLANTHENILSRTVKGQLLTAQAERAASNEDWQTARAKAAEAAALNPENLNFSLAPVSVAAMEGKHSEALRILDDVESGFGRSATITIVRTRILQESQGNQQAWRHIRNQWEEHQDPTLLPLLTTLTQDQAPEEMDTVTASWAEHQPTSTAARLTRANFLMSQSREAEAVDHYEAVLQRQFDTPMALNNLAWLLRESDTQRALELSERAKDLVPENAAILDTYGWVLHLAGRHQEALAQLEHAHRLAPENGDIKKHLDTVRASL